MTENDTKRRRIYNTALSAREAGLLADWERSRRAWVTLADLETSVGPGPARQVATRLVRKGVLERVAAGRYLVHPLRLLGRARSVSSPVVAAAILLDRRYYLGGLWALTFHRLTEQQYASVLDVFVERQRQPLRLKTARLVFHRMGRQRLTRGLAAAEFGGISIPVSTPERTLLDLLDLPALAGGVGPAVRLVQECLPKVSASLLVEQAVRDAKPSTCQRLGVLLEREGVSERKLQPLHRRVRQTKSLLSLVADAPRKGPVNRRWRVVENDR